MKELYEYKKTLKILYIEDDLHILNEMQNILKSFFSDILVATNGKEAFEVLNLNKVDIIISDMNMPIMDGMEFLKELRKYDDKTPFIFVTAKSEVSKILKAIELDIDGYILKPIDIKNLFEVIDKIIQKKYKNYNTIYNDDIIKINNSISWNKSTKILYKNNIEIKLTKKELLLIAILLTEEKIFDINEIIYQLWEEDDKEKDYISSLKNIISRLRNKLPELEIENIYGIGYKLKIS